MKRWDIPEPGDEPPQFWSPRREEQRFCENITCDWFAVLPGRWEFFDGDKWTATCYCCTARVERLHPKLKWRTTGVSML